MLHRLLFSVAVIALTSLQVAAAQSPISRELDPDGEMHGVRFGATEEQVRATLGPPTGSLQISDSRQVLFYGKSHAFSFRKGRLVELHVMRYLLDWELTQQMEEHPLLNSGRWTLKPGIVDGMTFGEVARLLNKPDARPDYRYSYETDKAFVQLEFSGKMNGQGGPDDFSLTSVRIKSFVVEW
jgi:hypothetical protein